MDIYVKVDGGIGRVIASTGAVEQFALSKKAEGINVNVVSTYPQLFNALDGINRIYHISMPYLYEDYISKGEFIEPEPYNHYLYYKDEEHISTVFNYLLNEVKEFLSPKISLTENEVSEAKQAMDDLRKQTGKKLMVIQPWGSQGGLQQGDKVRADESYRSWGMQFFKDFVAEYKKDYHILSVQSTIEVNGQQIVQYVMKDTMPAFNQDVRKVMAIIPHADVVVACDSFIHHASASLGTPVKTVVLWGGTSEKNLGYKEQVNIRNDKPVLIEPNRVPHDHTLYLNKNKGCNEFDIESVRKAI